MFENAKQLNSMNLEQLKATRETWLNNAREMILNMARLLYGEPGKKVYGRIKKSIFVDDAILAELIESDAWYSPEDKGIVQVWHLMIRSAGELVANITIIIREENQEKIFSYRTPSRDTEFVRPLNGWENDVQNFIIEAFAAEAVEAMRVQNAEREHLLEMLQNGKF